jgi:hypothetical protein
MFGNIFEKTLTEMRTVIYDEIRKIIHSGKAGRYSVRRNVVNLAFQGTKK